MRSPRLISGQEFQGNRLPQGHAEGIKGRYRPGVQGVTRGLAWPSSSSSLGSHSAIAAWGGTQSQDEKPPVVQSAQVLLLRRTADVCAAGRVLVRHRD